MSTRRQWMVMSMLSALILPISQSRAAVLPCALRGSDFVAELARLTPADALAAFYSGRLIAGPTEGTDAATTPWLAVLGATGALAADAAVVGDVVSSLALIGRTPTAAILCDLDVERRPGAPRLESMQVKHAGVALLFLTHGEDAAIISQLNRIVQRHTHTDVAKLSRREVNGAQVQKLVDERLPDWAVIEWGRIGPCYAITLGTGTFDRIAELRDRSADSVAGQKWFADCGTMLGDGTSVAWLVDFQGIRATMEQLAATRVQRVLRAMGALELQREFWVVGRHDRHVSCVRKSWNGNRESVFRYSDLATAKSSSLFKCVPDGAKTFAIVRNATPWLFSQLPASLVELRYHRDMRAVEQFWEAAQKAAGVDVKRDFIDQLGDDVLICDYPQHPTGMPFAVSIVAEVRDAEAVRRCVDGVCGALARHLDEQAAKHPADLLRLRLVKGDEEIWYLRLGLLGPGLCVTNQHLIVSWSPQAVREIKRTLATTQEKDATGGKKGQR